MRVDAAGGTPQPATQLEKDEVAHLWPCFLPDGKHFLYTVQGATRTSDGIYVGELGSNRRTLVMRNRLNAIYAEPGNLLFVRNWTLLAQRFSPRTLALEGEAISIADHVPVSIVGFARFTASSNGILAYRASGLLEESQLIWFDRAGMSGEPVIPETAQYITPVLSPDGKKLAVTIVDARGDGDIWVIDLARKTRNRLTFAPGLNSNAVWEPNGKAIVFASNREGLPHIYRVAADGTGREEKVLETPDVREVPNSLSADGRYLAYTAWDRRTIKRANEVWALPLFGARKPFPSVIAATDAMAPAISPDGKWVAYVTYESGKEEVYLKAFPTGEGKLPASTSGGSFPHWRRDGKELFFCNYSEHVMMAVDVRETAAGLELGIPRQLFRANIYSWCDVSADGQKFLIDGTTGEPPSDRLSLVTNWFADLKK